MRPCAMRKLGCWETSPLGDLLLSVGTQHTRGHDYLVNCSRFSNIDLFLTEQRVTVLSFALPVYNKVQDINYLSIIILTVLLSFHIESGAAFNQHGLYHLELPSVRGR